MNKVIEEIEEARGMGNKAIISSSYVSALDICDVALNEKSIKFVLIGGSMSHRAREKAREDFQERGDTHDALMSIKVGGTGVSFNKGNVVPFLELQMVAQITCAASVSSCSSGSKTRRF